VRSRGPAGLAEPPPRPPGPRPAAAPPRSTPGHRSGPAGSRGLPAPAPSLGCPAFCLGSSGRQLCGVTPLPGPREPSEARPGPHRRHAHLPAGPAVSWETLPSAPPAANGRAGAVAEGPPTPQRANGRARWGQAGSGSRRHVGPGGRAAPRPGVKAG